MPRQRFRLVFQAVWPLGFSQLRFGLVSEASWLERRKMLRSIRELAGDTPVASSLPADRQARRPASPGPGRLDRGER